MTDSHKSKAPLASRGVTLNTLKDQLHSLNMRMLLAMQNHDEPMQDEIRKQMIELQTEIDSMSLGSRFRR